MVKWSISFQRSCFDATSDCSCLSDSGLLLLETTWVTVEAIIIMQLLCAGRKTLGMQARYWGETDGDYGWIKNPLPLLSLQLLVPKTWIILFDNFLQYCIGKRMCPWLPASTPVSTVLCDVRHIRYIFFSVSWWYIKVSICGILLTRFLNTCLSIIWNQIKIHLFEGNELSEKAKKFQGALIDVVNTLEICPESNHDSIYGFIFMSIYNVSWEFILDRFVCIHPCSWTSNSITILALKGVLLHMLLWQYETKNKLSFTYLALDWPWKLHVPIK